MMQFRIEFVVALGDEAECHARCRQDVFQRRYRVLVGGMVRDHGAESVIGGQQREFSRRVRRIEHQSGRAVQEFRASRIWNRRQPCAGGPLPQRFGSAGIRKAGLREQARQLLGGSAERGDRRQENEKKCQPYRRNSISMGPSRWPWVN